MELLNTMKAFFIREIALSDTAQIHVVKMDQTLQRLQKKPNVVLFKTDYLE